MREVNPIPALLLAAGEGRRLKEYTKSKPLIQIAGIPLIGRVLHGLKKAGIKKSG
ncbi:MAG: NTP transferase domain-containing protein [Candidatus Bathyarchaeota archaeon]|nr:NTP transferase domain-containing protein [Candidatus Bathyarchaeota archaeon]